MYSFIDSDTRTVKGEHPVGERFPCFFSAKKSFAIFTKLDVSPKSRYGVNNSDFDLAPLAYSQKESFSLERGNSVFCYSFFLQVYFPKRFLLILTHEPFV